MTTMEVIAKLGGMIYLTALWCLFLKRGMKKDPNLYFVCMCMLGFNLMKNHALDNPISILNQILIWLFAIMIVVEGISKLHALWRRRKICQRMIKRFIARL